MAEEERWVKLRQIVREEVEAAEQRILAAMRGKKKLSFEGGKWIGVTEEQIESWAAAYPSQDIQAELKKMAAWCVSNPHLSPKSQWGRFVNTWLARNHNQASLRSIPVRDAPASSVQTRNCAYCSKVASMHVNGFDACDEHSTKAMDGEKPPRLKLA